MMKFILTRHSTLQRDVVEIVVDDKVAAVLYAQEPKTLRVISSHIVDTRKSGTSTFKVFEFDFE